MWLSPLPPAARPRRYPLGLFEAGICALIFALPAGSALAARSFDNCTGFIDTLPATISVQGTWCVRKDVFTSITSGAAIQINTNNVTIDCNDFKVGGLGSGPDTQTDGIHADSRSNIAVRNCNIRGFLRGIALLDPDVTLSGGHVIERNRMDQNTNVGILVAGDGSRIARNLIFDTGGSVSAFNTGILTFGGIDIIDNTISHVFGRENDSNVPQASVAGISSNHNGGTLQANRVRGLIAVGAGTAYGIQAVSLDPAVASMPILLRENDVTLDRSTLNSVGLTCGITDTGGGPQFAGRARDNMVQGFETPMDSCEDSGGNDLPPP